MALIDDLKDYLNISYEDDVDTRSLQGLLLRGQWKIDSYAGQALDYETEGLPRQLLFDYVRYGRNHALENFEDNFLPDIMQLRQLAEMGELGGSDG